MSNPTSAGDALRDLFRAHASPTSGCQYCFWRSLPVLLRCT